MFPKHQKQIYSLQIRTLSIVLFCCFLTYGNWVFSQAPINDDFTNPIDLTGLINSCSTDAQFTTLNATPDLIAGSCWVDGPNANVWFSFVATATGTIQVNLDRGNTKGDLRFAYMTLWDADCVTELSCSTYVDAHDDISLLYSGLTSGGTYHISVDRRYASTNDDFTLCLSDQPTNDYLEGATNIDTYMNGCSADAEFSTLAGTRDRNAASCWPNVVGPGPYRNVWFEVTAPATGTIEVKLDRGGVKGMLRTAYMALWEADGTTEVACNSYRIGSDFDDISMLATGLTAGNSYYLSVDNTYINEPDDFTLCLSDQPTNDYYEGATDITGLIGTCSANEAFSTLGATFDRNSGSCWPAQVEHNKWFSFTAPSTGRIQVNLDSGGAQGTLRHAYMSLWDADGTTELACTTYVNPDDDLSIQYLGLTPDDTYYISVDNRYVTTTETFALCLDALNGPDTDEDGVEDALDLDDDNDGILDSLENNCSRPNLVDGQDLSSTEAAIESSNLSVTAGIAYQFDSSSITTSGVLTGTAVDGPFAGEEINILLTNSNFGGVMLNGQTAVYYSDFTYYATESAENTGNLSDKLYVYYAIVDVNLNGTYESGIDELLGRVDPLNNGIIPVSNNSGPLYFYFNDTVFSDNLASLTDYGLRLAYCDFDSDGIGNQFDLDSDGDGIPDNVEAQTTIGYIAPNVDNAATFMANNGVNSAYLGGLTPTNTDTTDNPDYLDLDSDNEGGNDTAEAGITLALADSDGDGLDNASDATSDYTDVGGTIDNPLGAPVILPDTDSDANSGGDVDFRDAVDDSLDADNDGIPDVTDLDDDNDGILDIIECGDPPSYMNQSFELGIDPSLATTTFGSAPSSYLFLEGDVPNWETTATDNHIEIWDSGHRGVASYAGSYHAELNAARESALFQEYNSTPGEFTSITFAHRGRNGIDTMEVFQGPPGGPFTSLGQYSTGEAWEVYSTWFLVPAGQTNTQIRFEAISTSSGSISEGNLLDDIYIYESCDDTDNDGVPNGMDLDSDNDGIFDAIEAGHGQPQTGGRVDGISGSNGIPDVVETLPDSDRVNYTVAESTDDADSHRDYVDLDSDGDGIPDNVEAQTTIGYIAPNADDEATYLSNNGINSAYLGGLTPTNTDTTDNPDYLDLDSDNEGATDTAEAQITLLNIDSDNDGLDDATDATPDYSDVGGTIDDPLSGAIILLDTDSDANSGGDVDFRDALDDRLDTDNDGIADAIDLDDDNDGILDSEELNVIIGNTQPDCTGETILDFSTAPSLESGTDLQQGAVYRFPNVATGIDALVTIVETFNASVADIDNNAEEAQAFRPRTAFDISNVGREGYIEYRMQFVTSGGTAPVTVPKFFINVNDTDGNVDYSEEIYVENPTHYIVSNPTDLSVSYEFPWIVATGGTTEYTGAGNTNPQANFGINYENRSEIRFRAGITTIVPAVAASGREHNLDFRCTSNYINPEIYILDSDGDGYPNPIDLDSDNDGILDVVEAGHEQAHTLGRITGSVGADGVPDSVQTDPDGGTVDYSIAESIEDVDLLPNYVDLDADGDGIPDNVEAQTTTGYNAPSGTIDGNGVDTNYVSGLTPTNTDGADTPDYLDTDSDNEGGDDTTEAGITLSGSDTDNDGLDDATDATVDYSDVGGTIDDPLTAPIILPDADNDATTGGDVDFRDATDDRPDNDNDGIIDLLDLDDDNDGILDTDEGCGNLIINGSFEAQDFTDVAQFPGSNTDPWGTFIGAPQNTNQLYGWNYDQNIDGWVSRGTPPFFSGNTIADAYHGNQFIDVMGSNGSVGGINNTLTQTINTEIGQSYTFSFYWGEDIGFQSGWIVDLDVAVTDATNTVLLSEKLNYIAQGASATNIIGPKIWFRFERTFVATTSQTTVSFYATPTDAHSGAALDGVSVVSNGACRDTDNDGVIDAFDLDSDNDGIYDSVEIGHGQTQTNGRVDGSSGADGVPDVLQVRPYDEMVNYTAINSDSDGNLDFLDLDSDGDGIPDNVEAHTTAGYVSPNADDAATYLANNGVNSAYLGGLTPTNTDGTDNPDYLDTDSDNQGGDDTTEAGITLTGTDSDNDGLDDATDATLDYTDVGGTIDNPLTAPVILPDTDNDATTGGDVDFRDATDDRPDNDNDGIDDDTDMDDDNDGIPDTEEDANNDGDNDPSTDPTDTDNDGVWDYIDLDADNDGIPDNVEAQTTIGYIAPNGVVNANGFDTAYPTGIIPTNTDGTDNPDYLDTDSDNEGGDDTTEAGITLTGNDTDNDGLDDATDATADYTDVGGTIDNPLTAPVILPDADADATTGGDVDFRDATDDTPLLDLDSDDDGILDSFEDLNTDGDNDPSTNPTNSDNDIYPDYLDIDSDNDGIPDNVEAQSTAGYIPPSLVDVNDNGVDDAYETATEIGLIPVNTDGIDLPDYLDDDSDDDGVPDNIEAHDYNQDGVADVLFIGSDKDDDGLDDNYEGSEQIDIDVNDEINDPINDLPNTDGDSESDYRDLDDDNDGIPTMDEDANGDMDYSNDDWDNDGIPDYLDSDIMPEIEDVVVFNVVTPNGDGVHDFLMISGLETRPENTLSIYNRWGVLVYTTSSYNTVSNVFDGTSQARATIGSDEKLPVGTYFYLFDYVETTGETINLSGHLYLN